MNSVRHVILLLEVHCMQIFIHKWYMDTQEADPTTVGFTLARVVLPLPLPTSQG